MKYLSKQLKILEMRAEANIFVISVIMQIFSEFCNLVLKSKSNCK